MDGGHQALNDGKVVIDHLSQWSETVGGARSVARGQRRQRCVHGQLGTISSDFQKFHLSSLQSLKLKLGVAANLLH